MAVENIPWMIEGGIHTAASGRRVLNKATGGAEGVAAIGDLRVRQAAIANGTVIVAPGGATMVSRYPGVKGESYDGQNNSDTVVAVPANGGGSTRYDMVIARIDDWNMPGGQTKPQALPTSTVPVFKLQVVTGVSSTAKKAKDLNLNYPAIALARLAVPAGTAAITQAMIFDLREVAVPRRQRALLTRQLTAGDTANLTVVGGAGQQWPLNSFVTEVPEWATRARVVADWRMVRVPAGNAFGRIWFRLGVGDPAVVTSQQGFYDSANATNTSRINYGVADDLAVPAGLRGKSITCAMFGFREDSGGAGAAPRMDAFSSIVLDIEWLEAPAEDA
jgi:hypothetical protein